MGPDVSKDMKVTSPVNEEERAATVTHHQSPIY